MIKRLKKALKPILFPLWMTYLKIKDKFYALKGYRYNFSICAVFQNEARWLKEWIEYHKLIGVEHFWLYNNNSTDNYKEVLTPYIKEGIVDLIEWPSPVTDNEWQHFSFKVQTNGYMDAVRKSKYKTKWLAAIDIDEFLYTPTHANIGNLFNTHYNNCYGVCINWQCYGTSNVDEISDAEWMLDKLRWKAEKDYVNNLYHKTVMRPLYIRNCQNPHFFDYFFPASHVNARKDKIDMHANGVHIDLVRINHYWSKDRKFLYETKLPRWLKWGNTEQEILQRDANYNNVYDFCMEPFVQQLKAKKGIVHVVAETKTE